VCNGKAVCRPCIGADNRLKTTELEAEYYEKAYSAIRDLIKNTGVEPLKLFYDIELLWKRELEAKGPATGG
jgi:hypothetical protein